MLVHAVYFWLKPDLKPEDVRKFDEGVRSLLKIPNVLHGWVGKPAETDRPVIDRSYSYALVVAFEDMAGHDIYQVHPIHKSFLECSGMWTKVQIYDSI